MASVFFTDKIISNLKYIAENVLTGFDIFPQIPSSPKSAQFNREEAANIYRTCVFFAKVVGKGWMEVTLSYHMIPANLCHGWQWLTGQNGLVREMGTTIKIKTLGKWIWSFPWLPVLPLHLWQGEKQENTLLGVKLRGEVDNIYSPRSLCMIAKTSVTHGSYWKWIPPMESGLIPGFLFPWMLVDALRLWLKNEEMW